MIPLKDITPCRCFPGVLLLLIIANMAIFTYELSLGAPALKTFIENYGAIPQGYFEVDTNSFFAPIWRFLPLLTAAFLHGGLLHLLGNMWFLWIFGKKVEDRMGHVRFFYFYLGCAILSNLTHIYLNPQSVLPTIGASGAVAGILGAYFILFPYARILTLVPLFFFFYLVRLPAFFFLGLWFLIQFFSGAFSILSSEEASSGVAWWAHVGGFAAGIVLLPFFLIGRKGTSAKSSEN